MEITDKAAMTEELYRLTQFHLEHDFTAKQLAKIEEQAERGTTVHPHNFKDSEEVLRAKIRHFTRLKDYLDFFEESGPQTTYLQERGFEVVTVPLTRQDLAALQRPYVNLERALLLRVVKGPTMDRHVGWQTYNPNAIPAEYSAGCIGKRTADFLAMPEGAEDFPRPIHQPIMLWMPEQSWKPGVDLVLEKYGGRFVPTKEYPTTVKQEVR